MKNKELELAEIKAQINEMKQMLEIIYNHLLPKQDPARIYQLKEKARKKAIEIKQKLEIE